MSKQIIRELKHNSCKANATQVYQKIYCPTRESFYMGQQGPDIPATVTHGFDPVQPPQPFLTVFNPWDEYTAQVLNPAG